MTGIAILYFATFNRSSKLGSDNEVLRNKTKGNPGPGTTRSVIHFSDYADFKLTPACPHVPSFRVSIKSPYSQSEIYLWPRARQAAQPYLIQISQRLNQTGGLVRNFRIF